MWFRDGYDSDCAASLCKSRKNLGRRPWQWLDKRSEKKVWALHGKSKLTETEKRQEVKSKVKRMLIILFDIRRIVHKEFIIAGQTANFAYCYDALRRQRENVWTLSPKLWRQKNWLLHHDNAPFHTPFFTREFFTRSNMTVVTHQPC
jgi:hypothetical protein